MSAFGVFLTHLLESFFCVGPLSRVMHQLGGPGEVGVSFFYILTGFVLTWSHRPGDTPRALYRRRFARVARAYLVTLVAAIAVKLHTQETRRCADPGGAALDPGPAGLVPALAGLLRWEQCVLVGLLRGLLLCALPRLGRVATEVNPRLPAMGSRCAVPYKSAADAGPASRARLLPGLVGSRHLPPARLAEFVLGMLIAGAVRSGWRPGIPWSVAVMVVAAAYLVSDHVPYPHVVMMIPLALLIAVAAGRDFSGRSTVMARPWPRRLGGWPFASYLVHAPAIQVVRAAVVGLGEGVAFSLLGAFASLALALLAAITVYSLIEAPLERRLRGARPRLESTMTERP